MFSMEYWECPECEQRVFSYPWETFKDHICMSKRPIEEIHAIMDRALNHSGNGREMAQPEPAKLVAGKVAIAESKAEVAKTSLPKKSEVAKEAVPVAEEERVSLIITLADEAFGEMKMLAGYASEVNIIPQDTDNIANFIVWCIELGRESLRQYAVKRREYS